MEFSRALEKGLTTTYLEWGYNRTNEAARPVGRRYRKLGERETWREEPLKRKHHGEEVNIKSSFMYIFSYSI
jgi:hypothetical protein